MPSFSPSDRSPVKTSPSMEQYVEAIADLLTRGKVCSVSDIAEQVQVSRPAASRAVRELAERKLVEHQAYSYVDLTPRGQTLANDLNARHEALYSFFANVLHYDNEWADQEACRLEHFLGDDLVGRLTELHAFLQSNPDAAKAWEERAKLFEKE